MLIAEDRAISIQAVKQQSQMNAEQNKKNLRGMHVVIY